MEIRQAEQSDKVIVLKILDEFNDFANSLNKDWDKKLSTSARENSGFLFDEMINYGRSKVFIAVEGNEAVGFLEIHKVPRFRKSKYYGEIESMFVREPYHGKGVAQELMKMAFKWAQEQDLDCIRLYSGDGLDRAHAFYVKMGFSRAGTTFKTYSFK